MEPPLSSEENLGYITKIIGYWSFGGKDNYFPPYFLNVSYLIEDVSVILNTFSQNILVSAVYDELNPIAFYFELLTWDSFDDL